LLKQRSASGQGIDSTRNKSIPKGNLSTIEYFKNMQNLTVNKDLKLPIKIKRQRVSKDNLLSKQSSDGIIADNSVANLEKKAVDAKI
jgi:hypothetical protein